MLFKFAKTAPSDESVTQIIIHQGSKTWFEVSADGRRSLQLGMGPAKSVKRRNYAAYLRKALSQIKNQRLKNVALGTHDLMPAHLKLLPEAAGELMAANFEMANFEFLVYKTPPKEGWNLVEQVTLVGEAPPSFKKGIAAGQLIGQSVNETRVLANTPGGEMTPVGLAQAAREAIKGTRARLKVLNVAQMKKLGMGAILGVAAGSPQPPRFIIMEYFGGAKSEKPLVLVGKGVTFDTGGLNLKPGDHIYEMHMDMSGGAAVIHALALAAKLNLKKNIIALVPAVENMLGGASYRPGDILRTLSGKTVEVLNTDGEGRLILADALTYAARYNPRLVVDVATLTGAAMVALGHRVNALFSSDEKIARQFVEIGEQTGDPVWPMPLWPEYEDDIRGNFADWANVGRSKMGGAIHGAVFLKQFVQDYPWVHIDMAPRMTAAEGDYLAKGASGSPVPLLAAFLRKH